MKITKLSIPKSFQDDGIEDINMSKLSNIVLIAGINGSGKTRILKKIEAALKQKPSLNALQYNRTRVQELQKALEKSNKELIQLEFLLNGSFFDNADVTTKIEQIKQDILHHNEAMELSKFLIEWKLIETDKLAELYTIVPFVPKNSSLQDPGIHNKSSLLLYSNSVSNLGVESLAFGTLARIQLTQDRWFNATHQHSTVIEDLRQQIIGEYETLKNILKIFLNTELGRNADGDATLFDRPLGLVDLSEGQKILIQLCIAIYAQEFELDELVLFLDEPENHLHPSIIIEIIDRLVKCVPNGQIWISTHSVPLLAHFDPSNIWYVEKGKISYAGNIPEKVLNGLLGDEIEIGKLQDFINLPSQYALNRYAYECLFQPSAVITDKNDPQSIQINSELQSLVDCGVLKILDYGAGKGRLLSHLFEGFEGDVDAMNARFDYVAYDEYNFDKADCLAVIGSVNQHPELAYFNDMKQLLTFHDAGSFDVIVMCNVLHEIDPSEWLRLFRNDGTLTKLLKETGLLIIVEDTQMPVGEKAYQKGFIVFDTPQIKDLFKIRSGDFGFKASDARGDGRLKAHTIPKKYLENITADTKITALRSLRDQAHQKILKIRSGEQSYKTGRIHAFWVQQFANTCLALAELTTE